MGLRRTSSIGGRHRRRIRHPAKPGRRSRFEELRCRDCHPAESQSLVQSLRSAPFKARPIDPSSTAYLDANTGEWYTFAQFSGQVTAFAQRLRVSQKAIGFHFGYNDSAGLIAYLGVIESAMRS
jgi:hypothetical protein